MFNNFDFKYVLKRIIIGVAISFILFNINKCNANAMVRKDTIGTQPTWNPRSKNGSVNSGSWAAVNFPLNGSISLNTNYDYIGIQLNNSEFITDLTMSIDNPYLASSFSGTLTCTRYDTNNVCVEFRYNDSSGTFPQDLIGSIELGDTYHYYVLMTTNTTDLYPCFFSSEMEEVIFCPTKNNGQSITMTGITFYLGNKASSSLNYYITLDDIKTYYNENSTEIVNALQNVTIAQSDTTSAINDTLDTINDTNTSSSSTSANIGFNNMNDQLTQNVDSLASVNTYNSIINNFFTEINNSTCSPINLPMPFVQGKNIVLPCIGTEINNVAPTLWTFWRFMCAGIIGFALWSNMISFIKGILDPYNIGANNLPLGGGK